MSTSEIVERLREGVPFEPRGTFSGKLMFEAAARLSELERENARMREALVKSEDILRRAEIDSELDALCVIRAALASLNAALAQKP